MRKSFTYAAMTCAVAASALAIAACGAGGDSSTSSGPGNAYDRAFVAGMIPHHQSAIEMATTAEKLGQSPFVRTLASDIATAQSEEIAKLRAIDKRLEAQGVAVGHLGTSTAEMGMNMKAEMLRGARPFDRAFIDMMVPHHQGAIRMARIELEKGENPELHNLAQRVIAAQSREIRAMNAYRTKRFSAPSPAGGIPSASSSSGADSMQGMPRMSH